MVSHRQKRLWRYVEEGSLLKLKSYLRKHRDLEVNFSQGRRQRSPLHLACSRGDDAVLRLLLRHGADVLQKDRKGDTALHVAANRALKHGKTAYDDLVVPLKNCCPEALIAPNSCGVTPQDLLHWMRHTEVIQVKITVLLFSQTGGFSFIFTGVVSNHFFIYIAQEQEERSRKELHERLQREHEEYLARAARKEEETRQGKKRRYDEKCAATFQGGSSASSTKLSYSDIPWPAPQGTVQEMLDVMLHGVDRKDVPLFRKMLRKQQALWHPDKFAQRCEARLEEKDKRRILDTVTALSQELNRLAQSLRT
uniref:NF-kappa-B inhibitor-like protein 1 n=1 Tax=Mastacembelus armatus TaxID=205130 RepID=A0A7N9AY37_9TELE